MSEVESFLFAENGTDRNESSEFLLTEFSIKQEPELIIEDELETDEIHTDLQKTDIKQEEEDQSNLIWYNCIMCEERFLSTEDLSLHIQNHKNSEFNEFHQNVKDEEESSETKKNFQYPKDMKGYSFRKNSRNHQLKINTEDKLYKCGHCDYSFKQRSDLQSHMMVHTGEKPYKCDHCDRSFARKSTRRDHVLTHTGEKPFICDHCDCSFARKRTLQIHVRTHTGEKPYKCEYCIHSFAESRILRNHLRTHFGEESFKYDPRDLAFLDGSNAQTKMGFHNYIKCCVVGCGNEKRNTPDIRYFTFPSDEPTKQKWINLCQVSSSQFKKFVCSIHFDELCFTEPARRLFRYSIPSLFLPKK